MCIFHHTFIKFDFTHTGLFIYTSLFWFICKLLALDECLHVSIWMACEWCLCKCFTSMPNAFCGKRTKTWHFWEFIHAIPSGNRVECVSIHIRCRANKKNRAVVYCTNCASKSTQSHIHYTHTRINTENIHFALSSLECSNVHDDMMMLFFTVDANGLHSSTVIRIFVFISNIVLHTWAFY